MKRNSCPVDLFMKAPISYRLSYNYDINVNPIYYEEDLPDRELLHRLDSTEQEDLSKWSKYIARLNGGPNHPYAKYCLCLSCLDEWWRSIDG